MVVFLVQIDATRCFFSVSNPSDKLLITFPVSASGFFLFVFFISSQTYRKAQTLRTYHYIQVPHIHSLVLVYFISDCFIFSLFYFPTFYVPYLFILLHSLPPSLSFTIFTFEMTWHLAKMIAFPI